MSAMSSKQYKAALKHYGLTQGHAAWLFNGKTRDSGRRWAAEGAPYHVALLLSLMYRCRLTPDDIEEVGAIWRKQDQDQDDSEDAS